MLGDLQVLQKTDGMKNHHTSQKYTDHIFQYEFGSTLLNRCCLWNSWSSLSVKIIVLWIPVKKSYIQCKILFKIFWNLLKMLCLWKDGSHIVLNGLIPDPEEHLFSKQGLKERFDKTSSDLRDLHFKYPLNSSYINVPLLLTWDHHVQYGSIFKKVFLHRSAFLKRNRNRSPNSHQKIWRTCGLWTGALMRFLSDIHKVCTNPENSVNVWDEPQQGTCSQAICFSNFLMWIWGVILIPFEKTRPVKLISQWFYYLSS